MYKYSFYNDYSEGAHPNILQTLVDTNLKQETGYGFDSFSVDARKKIQNLCKKDVEVYFVSGGTQANLIALSSMMRPFESVVSAFSGHINMHESGAIEATGHKVNAIKVKDGKLTPEIIGPVVQEHKDDHMVLPKVVYISQATEVGTVYSKTELEKLSLYCKENGLFLFLDGARLSSALTSDGMDLTLEDIANLCDMFYIGGTKCGTLLGEAIVITNDVLKKEFFRNVKQRGGLLAKGRLLGIQFFELFKNDLYFELGRKSNRLAKQLTDGISKLGFKFLTESKTNQIFPIFPSEIIKKMEEFYGFYIWEKVDEKNSAIRLVTSWATKEDAITEFLNDLTIISTLNR